MDVKSDNMGGGLHPCFVVFDILLINDEKLANRPLHERIKKCKDVFNVTNTRLQHVERKVCNGDWVRSLNPMGSGLP